MQTSASFQRIAREMAHAATRVMDAMRSVPRVDPLRPERWVVSVERKEVRAPDLLSSLSKKVIS